MNGNIKKIMIIVILSFVFVFDDIEASCDHVSELQQYNQYAIDSMKETGIYASLILAQGIIESGLGKNGSSHMGIKLSGVPTLLKSDPDFNTKDIEYGKKCAGKGGIWDDTEEEVNGDGILHPARACFKPSKSIEESLRKQGDWLLNNWGNGNNIKKETTLLGQLHSLRNNPNAVYATDSEYVCKLISVINSCDLTQYDVGVNFSGRGVTITGKRIPNLSKENCSYSSTGSNNNNNNDLEHFGTSYTGDLTKGWIYERFEFSETFDNQLSTDSAEENIDDIIDEIFNRAKTSYFSIYGSSSGGSSYGYSAQACSELENKTGFGPSSGWKQGYDLWSKIPIAGSNIGDIGCLVTSIAIQLDRMGVDTGINNFNPGTFVCHLSKNGKFTSGGDLYHSWVNLFSNISLTAGFVTGTETERATQIQNLINDGCYLVVYAPYGNGTNPHHVAVSGTTVNDIKIIDPGSNYSTLWGSGYYDFGASTAYRCLKKVG